ncbi:MAG: prephenate dehydrogenase/arogenate dehydrogenase family protein [Opitutales bacterium]|nr:prephenate dehydrogenase/arogenate dehydrogenase family protein [Opitutales bacterium]
MPLFHRVTILGPGLLGASLCMAIKERMIADKVRVWARKQSALELCKQEKWCDEAEPNLKDAVKDTELIVICTPVNTIEETLCEIIQESGHNSIITDVGSVKENICRIAHAGTQANATTFIGSHPMAGSEKSGMEYAHSDLFNHRTCMITPLPTDSAEKVSILEKFWVQLGMNVQQKSPEEHDKIVASVSHLPHLIASSLAEYLSHSPDGWLEMSGQGLKDTSRIAGGDPSLWREIMKSNRSFLLEALDSWLGSVNDFKNILTDEKWDELENYLAKAKECRTKI